MKVINSFKHLKTKSSLTSYSLTVHEFSTEIYLFLLIHLFVHLFIYLSIIFISFSDLLINCFALALEQTYLLHLNINIT